MNGSVAVRSVQKSVHTILAWADPDLLAKGTIIWIIALEGCFSSFPMRSSFEWRVVDAQGNRSNRENRNS
jgi:hypothetical protein